MSWMDDMWINTKSAANAVGQKTGEVIDRSKLRLAIIDLKSDLFHKYAVLGKLCYESYRTGKDYAKEMLALEKEIADMNVQLSALKDKLAHLQKKVKCPSCGTYNPQGALFCRQCGSRLAGAAAKEEDSQEELLDFAEKMAEEEDI